jgi:hypothetical protein
MFNRLILFVLIAGLVYLNYTTPKIEDHKAFLLSHLQQGHPIPQEMQEKIWRDIDYSNFMVCSFMKTKIDSKMISSGYLKKVKMINTKWVEETKAVLQTRLNSY